MKTTEVLPSSVEIKYEYLKIDDLYMSTVTIIEYSTNIELLNTMQALMDNDEIEISFHVKRENNVEVLKKLTNIISESSSEIGSISKNQIDINELDSIKCKASDLRRKIQIDNEQIYKLSTYVVVKAKDLVEVVSRQKKYINTLFAKQIVAKPSNFRQREAYLATIPILLNSSMISKYTHSIFTEHALAKLFPFFERDVLNKDGILVGKTNDNLCSIDIFSTKNNNYNMCVFGSSGAGKSYFVKLMIMKNAYKGIRQIIIDPEGEYVNLVNNLGGKVYSIENYNPFEIEESFLENLDFFNQKVEQIIDYILQMNKNKYIDKDKLRSSIVKVYSKFGINERKESLYKLNSDTKIYIKPKYTRDFPGLKDLVLELGHNRIKLRNYKKDEQNESLSNQELYCFNLKGRNPQSIEQEMKVFIPKVYELITKNTLIYFDEIWKGISLGHDRFVIENIYNMFKTLRKRTAGIVAISQDICDLFALDDGNFGKSILNNANITMLFKMEWQDIEMLERVLQNIDMARNIKMLSRGNAYVSMGNTKFNLEVKATEYEHKLIEGDNYEKDISGNE